MEFLNKAAAQISDLFKGMTPGARMTAGLLLVMIVVSLVYLVVFQGGKADRYLYGSQEFTREELAAMQRAFGLANLDDYELEGQRVRVPHGRRQLYQQALTEAGFAPADMETDIEEIRQRGSSIWDSDKDKDFWREQAQQQKLARAIAKRPEVDWATVQYREVKKLGFPPKVERTATVVASGAGGQPLDRSTVMSIRATASSWFTISPESVAVTDVNGSTLGVGEETDGLSKEARGYAEAKSFYEDYYRTKIQQCLSFLGAGVVASVNVEVDPTITNESSKVTIDPQTVSLESESFTKTSENRPATGGRPGTGPNEVQGNQARTLTTLANQESTSDENREQQVNVTGHEQTRQLKAGYVPKMVTTTVSIPRSYFKQVWLAREPIAADAEPPEPTEAQVDEVETEIIPQIEDKVVEILPPLAAGEDQYPRVEVSSYYDLPEETLSEPSLTAMTMSWIFTNWKTLGLFCIGLISLVLLRNMVRTANTTGTAPVTEAALPELPPAEEEEFQEPQVTLHRRSAPTGLSLREELISMVREDPDAAASVLRTWIGDAA